MEGVTQVLTSRRRGREGKGRVGKGREGKIGGDEREEGRRKRRTRKESRAECREREVENNGEKRTW